MKNIISNLVMLIDLYYYRKRIMIRWRSIKHYQRVGKIKPKITKGKYPIYQIPVSPNPPRPTKKIVESRVRQAPPPPPRPRSASIYSKDFKELFKQRGASINIIEGQLYDYSIAEINYKNIKKRIQFTDHVNRRQIEDCIFSTLDQIDAEIVRLCEGTNSIEPFKIGKELSEFLKANNVLIQLQLNEDPKLDIHSTLVMQYEGKIYKETYFSKPLNIDIKNSVKVFIKRQKVLREREEQLAHSNFKVRSHMGIEVYNPLSVCKLIQH